MKFEQWQTVWTTYNVDKIVVDSVAQPYTAVVVCSFADEDVSKEIHYIVKVFTAVDNYFDMRKESQIFETREQCHRDAKHRYNQSKMFQQKMKQAMQDIMKNVSKQ